MPADPATQYDRPTRTYLHRQGEARATVWQAWAIIMLIAAMAVIMVAPPLVWWAYTVLL